jgi:TM2 domain-containing membrane protein YozV
MKLSTEENLLVEMRVSNDGPSVTVAYLLWLFLGFVSAHRFYLGRPISALLQIASFFVLVGFVWLFVDLFLIPGMVRDKQNQIRQQLRFSYAT